MQDDGIKKNVLYPKQLSAHVVFVLWRGSQHFKWESILVYGV